MGVRAGLTEIPPDSSSRLSRAVSRNCPMSRGTRLTKLGTISTSFFGAKGHRSVLRLLATSFTPRVRRR